MSTSSFTRRSAVALVLLSSTGLAASSARAQTAPAPGEAAVAKTDDIIVTARRRNESQQDVPIAITVLSGDSLARRSVLKFEDIKTQTPGLAIQDGGFSSLVPVIGIRGQIQKTSYLTGDNSVGVYLNEVILSRSQGLNASVYDLDSIQVLKGPQGTLFGRNTPGGAILYSTKAPTKDFGGYFRLMLGNYDLRSGEGAINIPIAEGLQARFAGQAIKRRGYVLNLATGHYLRDEDSTGWRASLHFDRGIFRNDLVVDGNNATPRGDALKITFAYPNAAGARALPTLTLLAQQPFETASVSEGKNRARTLTVSERAQLDVTDDISIKNIFGYRRVSSDIFLDLDGTPIVFQHTIESQRVDQYTDELQVLGKSFSDRLNWIVGGFYLLEEGTDAQQAITATALRLSQGDVRNRSQAVYAQATYKLVATVSLTGGLRYTEDDRRLTSMNFTNGVCRINVANTGTAVIDPCLRTDKTSSSKLTYTVSLDWKLTPGTLLYATNRRGYRAGGFGLINTRPADFTPYKPETVTDYELGAKIDWRLGDVRGRLNAAAFYSDFKDIQRIVNTSVTQNGQAFLTSITANAASAKIKGFEIEAMVRPFRPLTLTAFVSHVAPKYDRFMGDDGIDRSAQAFSSTPHYTAGGAASVDVPLGGSGTMLTVRGDLYYQSTSYTQDSNTDLATGLRLPQERLGHYMIANARADIQDLFAKGTSLGLYTRNLFNKRYYKAGTDLGSTLGTSALAPGDPRTFGIQLGYRF